MSQLWKMIVSGTRWMWKNSWWIVPAGEEIFNRIRKKLNRKSTNQ